MAPNRALAEIVVGLYVCLTFAVLVVEATVAFIDAANVDRYRRPYVWMTGSFDCFFHLVHLLLIVVWAACMYKDNYDGMAKSLVGISARVMGLGLCTTIDLGRTIIVKPPYLGSYFQRQIMHREKNTEFPNIYTHKTTKFWQLIYAKLFFVSCLALFPIVILLPDGVFLSPITVNILSSVGSTQPLVYKVILLFIEALIISQMEIYQMSVQADAAALRSAAAEASPETYPFQQPPADTSNDGTVVAGEGAHQAPPGTAMPLVVPVQPPEAEDQQQHSMQSMQPLTASAKQQPERTASGATNASSAGTRV